jgi:hypothetical protein
MPDPDPDLPDWERLLAVERHLQALVPGTVLVGGTAAALHAGHRRSQGGDHVLTDLRDRYDEVLADLEDVAGWQTTRLRRPSLILVRLDGVMTGIRQLRRTRRPETETVQGLRVPTLAEMARIKAWLLATRDTMRDYLDTVVLLECLGADAAVSAFASFDEIYRQPTGTSPLVEVVERLARAAPGDAARIDLASYRGLLTPWNEWEHVIARGRDWARVLAGSALGAGGHSAPTHPGRRAARPDRLSRLLAGGGRLARRGRRLDGAAAGRPGDLTTLPAGGQAVTGASDAPGASTSWSLYWSW